MVQWVQKSTTADPSLFSPSGHTEQDLTEKERSRILLKLDIDYNSVVIKSERDFNIIIYLHDLVHCLLK